MTTAYISASANRHHHTAAASASSRLVFGTGSLIALWDVTDEHDRGIYETLDGHEGLVVATCFLEEMSFVSGDDKGFLILWKYKDLKWHIVTKVKAHLGTVTCLVAWKETLVSGSSDSTAKVWTVANSELAPIQTIQLKGKYPLSLALTDLPKSGASILAIGLTGREPLIFTRSESQFVQSASLPGHEDWVRCLDFQSNGDTLVLASGSQDSTIRLWNIEAVSKLTAGPPGQTDELLDTFEASLGELADTEEGGKQISLKRHILTVKMGQSTAQFSITFDALLIGHEAGVTSLSWRPSSSQRSAPTLLSTSTDSSVILWSPTSIAATSSESSSIWINRRRFGDVGGQRLGGFVGGLWVSNGQQVLAHGWSGGWRRWKCDSALDTVVDDEVWTEAGAVGGHFGPVKDACWSLGGEYLISVGLDQTTRIHGPIPQPDGSHSWHELGRPQVHGYDLVGAAFLSPLEFVSVADEKVARFFEAPRAFVDLVELLGVTKFSPEEHERPATANVPPLGLSNKATETNDNGLASAAVTSHRRPYDSELAGSTLWPEKEKVFGHGYESITVSVSNNKKFAATTCKASTSEHAVVRVYDTTSWQPFGKPLEGHMLTITRVEFSPDDSMILTVSRDRAWRLFQLHGNDGYLPLAADKSHARIIWDCSWAPNGETFATASRDKLVKVWQRDSSQKWVAISTIKCDEAATAVAFDPSHRDGQQQLAVGLETGEIQIYTPQAPAEWTLAQTIPRGVAHVNHVSRIAWRPRLEGSRSREIVSCSEDGTLKLSIVRGVET